MKFAKTTKSWLKGVCFIFQQMLTWTCVLVLLTSQVMFALQLSN